MSNIPAELKYTTTHEWVRELPDGSVELGITDYAQQGLGDMVSVEVPKVGRHVASAESYALLESVKAASDLSSPIAGEVTAVNAELSNSPVLINTDPYGRGWIVRMRPTDTNQSQLLSAAEYAQQLQTEGG
jgi:glycine cleavage system H protein